MSGQPETPMADREVAPPPTDAQWDRLRARGVSRDVQDGEVLYVTGQCDCPMIIVEDGEIEIVRDSLAWLREEVIATLGPRSFAGEVGLLNGQRAFLTVRATGPGRVREVSRAELRRLLAEDNELGDIILHAFWARREMLRRGSAAFTLKIVGEAGSGAFVALRRFAERLDLVHMAVEIDPEDPAHPLHSHYTVEDLPIVFLKGQPLVRATPGALAEHLGLSYEPGDEDVVDLVVIGGGPAGLASAIYAASEGLSTVLVDAVAPGGQAASTSRIENYLGFPFGVSGGALTGQATLQAIKFGVRVCAPCEAVSLRAEGDQLTVVLSDGRGIRARSAMVTSGATYRSLGLERWGDFEANSIHYAATALEVKQVVDSPVVVGGGANSAGQAAFYLAASGCAVHLVVRGDDLRARMSSYLVERLLEDPRIHVHLNANVTGLDGDTALSSIMIDTAGRVDARGLFCFIGAEPAADWLRDVDRDDAGFIRTGTDVTKHSLAQWQEMGREPLPFETSIPVFSPPETCGAGR